MTMSLEEFWAVIDFTIAASMQLFTLLDAVVVIDSPRLSLFNVMISVIFLTLIVSIINWLRGGAGSGSFRWDYFMMKDKQQYDYQAFDVERVNTYMRNGMKEADLQMVRNQMQNFKEWDREGWRR